MKEPLQTQMIPTRIESTLAQYDITVSSITRMDTLWNTMLRLRSDDGKEYALRLCNSAIRDIKLIRQEIAFIRHVASFADIQVPVSIPTREGDEIATVYVDEDPTFACMFEWIEGEDLRGRASVETARLIGRATACLHRAARTYPFPVSGDGMRESYRWDEGLVSEHHAWIDQRDAVIGPERSTLLHKIVDQVAAQLTAIPKTRDTYGMIHADLHQGNFIEHDGVVAVIDFDQLGRGHFAYDLANVRTELKSEPVDTDALWHAVKTGYSEILPLPFQSDADLEPFLLAGELGFLDWYYNSPNPEVREQLSARFEHTWTVLLSML
ncbi:MAG: phosphotransferase [Caldilineaceae bacterium]